MNAALDVATGQDISTHATRADSSYEIWEPLDLLAEESAVWRNGAALRSMDT